MAKISACMIAKNEEKMLPRCLDSIKDLCDEIILLDTGSTDKTMDIAKSYGAKVYVPENLGDYFVETGSGKRLNFSMARNKAHSYATGDWQFVIDCDERLLPPKAGFEAFKKRFDRVDPEIAALVATLIEKDNDGDGQITCSWMGCRFFRSTCNLRWKNIVHNKGKYDGGCAKTDIVIQHYGYSLSPEAMAKKIERTKSLLFKRLEGDPNDFDAMFYLCQIYMSEKEGEKAIEMGTKCMEIVPITDVYELSYYSVLYYMLGTAYLWQRDGHKAYAWTKKGIDAFPNDLDLNFLMARIGYSAKRDDLLKQCGHKYLELLPRFRNRHDRSHLKSFKNEITVPETAINRNIYTLSRESEAVVRGWLDG